MSKMLFSRRPVCAAVVGCMMFAAKALAPTDWVVAADVVAGPSAVPGTLSPSHVDIFTKPSGETFYAVGLTPKVVPAATRPHDIVVLFDTSASQSGEFREKGLTALKSLFDTLADADRVRLFAVDLAAVPLTDSFVSTKSPAMTAGMTALRKRVPLGATDMAGALNAALESLGERNDRGAAVVYLGDGMSTAQLINSPRMQHLVNQFVGRRAAISSFAIGPRLDTALLGILATHTGGGVVVDQEELGANQIGMHLAGLAAGEVIWPREVQLPETLGDVYPKQFPPLRTDRDSIVIGRADRAPTGEIAFSGELAGRPVRLKWQVTTPVVNAEQNNDNAYLTDLVSDAKKDGGLCLPLVNSSVLQQVGELVGLKTHALVRLAQQALATGSNENAERLANEALRLDASHPEALAVRHALQKMREGKGGSRPLKLVNFQVPAENIGAPPAQPTDVPPAGAAPAGNDDLLRRVQEENRVLADLMRIEVTNSVTRARSMLGTEPAAAIDLLKLALDKVSKAPELSADARTQLRNQIEASLMEASRRKVVKEETDLRQQQIDAERRARATLVNDLQNRQEKLKQLMDRFENLMDERRYGDAADMAALARAEEPRIPAIAQAFRNANDVSALSRARATREASHLGFQAAMSNIDATAIPFSDDPPVVYPDAEQWRLMTEKRAKYRNVDLASKKSDNEKAIIEALGKKVTLENLEQIPLKDVIDIIKAQQKIPMIFDTKALTDANIQEDTLVSINVKDVTLRSALRVLLRPIELTYIIKDEVLQVTSKTAADDIPTNGVTKVYPVADLVVPIPQGGLSGFGGLGGSGGGIGGGGGMGGMGGGGGLGGGGGGFGGGGGGFAVPAENLDPNAALDNALAFNDGLKLSGKKPAATATPAPATLPAAIPAAAAPTALSVPATVNTPAAINTQGQLEPIKLEVAPGETLDAAWDRHFTDRDENPLVVRETVRRLMKQKQFDQIVALIHATLRHDQAQPWMYEALGIAMQADGAAPQEVERAMMSAVDFRAKASDLIHVAQYLLKAFPGNQTIEQRALKLYQQVVAMEPTQPQAYVESLLLAQRLNDIEAVQWATAGILSQAWPKDQREIPAMAERVSAATYELLKSQKKFAEAEAFKKAIDAALVRDCMIVVSWTGNADIDLLVEEPSGTVCSFRNPRTTSGGMMMGDSMSSGDDRTAGASSESYVCPQGFNGTYKMLLRRVWGKTTVDKVTVDYFVHRGTPNERHFRKQIALADGEAAVALELKNGRRTEPLEQEQVINAVAGQMAIGRAILAQQLAGLPDISSATGGGIGSRANGFFPIRGAVGYQPIIITLPTGANMSAVAVVSADRRYVRVTAQPLFSTIPSVNTFNYQSGSSGTSGGATSAGSTGSGGT